jgi:hypothetical protein
MSATCEMMQRGATTPAARSAAGVVARLKMNYVLMQSKGWTIKRLPSRSNVREEFLRIERVAGWVRGV